MPLFIVKGLHYKQKNSYYWRKREKYIPQFQTKVKLGRSRRDT